MFFESQLGCVVGLKYERQSKIPVNKFCICILWFQFSINFQIPWRFGKFTNIIKKDFSPAVRPLFLNGIDRSIRSQIKTLIICSKCIWLKTAVVLNLHLISLWQSIVFNENNHEMMENHLSFNIWVIWFDVYLVYYMLCDYLMNLYSRAQNINFPFNKSFCKQYK